VLRDGKKPGKLRYSAREGWIKTD